MNRYFILIGILAVCILGSIFYVFASSEKGVTTGRRVDVAVSFDKGLQSFVPDVVSVTEGDSVHMTFTNDDVIQHGIAIDAYGIARYVPPHTTVSLPPFLATQVGNFTFYCPLPAPAHLSEIGKFVVVRSPK